ncbi:MAG: TIGR01212 family radical SAM protein [Treponema sp.]|nr:TIGR01212 family radical SAM protein [Treponema sp.]
MPISLSDFYKNKFGRKVYKLAVDAGCTCPTRDGRLDTRGCIFCSANGSGDFMPPKNLSVPEQLERAKEFVQKKALGRAGARSFGQDKKAPPAYIAYFQNFTNTYGDPDALRQKYFSALEVPDIVGVDIATRPDCLGPEILEVIKELSQKTFVTVELGLQTVHQKTADYIRRGYQTNIYYEAVAALKKTCPSVHIVTQLILGLPGEDDEQMLESVRRVVAAKSDGIKITCLYVLEGTDLEKEWRAGNFECLSKEKYFGLLKKIAPLLPPEMVVHRLTGDGPKKILLAPDWTKNKRQVLNELAALKLF